MGQKLDIESNERSSLPIRDNPKENEFRRRDGPHGAATTKNYIGPIQHRLRQRHKRSCETNQGRRRPEGDMREIQIRNIRDRFDNVQQGFIPLHVIQHASPNRV